MPRSSTIALCALGATTVDAFAPSVLRSTRVMPLASTETEEWSAPAMPSSDGAATDAVPEEVAAVQSAPRTSLALPFMNAPKTLDGTLAGDMGFDPLGFADCRENLLVYREAEVKHARLAMLAAAGWPLAELFHKEIASSAGLSPILNADGRNPSVLNGFTGPASVAFVVAAFAGIGMQESVTLKSQYISPQDFNQRPAAFAKKEQEGLVSGGFDFDPLNLYNFFGPGEEGRQVMRTSELKNGRLAMMAITGMAIQEAVFKKPVVEQTPIFFKPVWESVAQLLTGDVPALYTEEGVNTKQLFGTSAPLDSFQYPDETTTAAPAAAVMEVAPAAVSAPVEAVAAPVMEAAPAVVAEPAAAVMEAAPAAIAEAVAPVVEAASSVMAATADALPSTADVAEVVTKVAEATADIRDMALPDFSAL